MLAIMLTLMLMVIQVLARPEESASREALARYTSGVLKALFREEILKQIGMDR